MGFATIDKTGKFTGTVYTEMTSAIELWHDKNEFTYIEIDGKLSNVGTDNNPDYGTPTESQLRSVKEFERKLDKHIDSVAQSKDANGKQRYDNRITASLRAAAPNSPWHAEGVAFIEWMDLCYAKAMEIMGEVQAGTRPVPTWEEIEAELPIMVWPE